MPTGASGTAAADPRRPRLTPAIADLRRAVRTGLTGLATDAPAASGSSGDSALILVAMSGGADSLALAAATVFEAPRAGMRAGAVIVDHGLQPGSADQAERAAGQARAFGLDPVEVVRASVGTEGGPEAAARAARYAALEAAATRHSAQGVLLGHTLEDQAETVLLGLARGSGAASLRGMAARTGLYLRPLLDIHRSTTRQACVDAGLQPWDDPWNEDQAYARARVRHTVLPTLEAELGPGIADALARTALQLREDSEALDDLALDWALELTEQDEETGGVTIDARGLAADPPALRQRIVRLVVVNEFGLSLSREHTLAITALIDDWHGQGAPSIPGIRVVRQNGRLLFTPL